MMMAMLATLAAVLVATLIAPSLQCGSGNKKLEASIKAQSDLQRRGIVSQQRLYCAQSCIGPWEQWTPCTKLCAGGKQKRTRAVRIDANYKSSCTADGLTSIGEDEELTKLMKEELGRFDCSDSKIDEKACNEGCPFHGFPHGGTCKCPRGRAGGCCEKELYCSYPGNPPNAKVIGSWPAHIGSVVDYSCKVGYSYMEGSTSRQCEKMEDSDSAMLVGTVIKCKEIRCIPPQVDPHIIILNNKSGFAYEQNIAFRCDDGYERLGPDSQECGPQGWSDYTPTCRPVSCPDPGSPINGRRSQPSTGDAEGLEDLTYPKELHFNCTSGFTRVGSEILRCTKRGTWFGDTPTCEEISCEAPYTPINGAVRVRRGPPSANYTGEVAIFTCEEGHVVMPEERSSIKCSISGYWEFDEPECKSIDCGDPGIPENGFKDGSIFTFGWEVKFTCFPGYTRNGSETIECLPNGAWSHDIPLCEPCPKNTYAGTNNDCIKCPANSHTLSPGSKQAQECGCDYGYVGHPGNGGDCELIECEPLPTPEHGEKGNCTRLAGGQCNFICDDGYVLQRGTSVRVCQTSGVWNNEQPLCGPCPINTFKSSELNCDACPMNSETMANAQMADGCLCRVGYQGPAGGPCTDSDECEENGGKGPCEDVCENRPGSYDCRCTIPGEAIDLEDPHKCFPELQCKNITADEAPGNGGLVCKWSDLQASQWCQVRCNPGYDHPIGVNSYETCGPTTDFEWSFRLELNDATAPLPSCIEEFFPGFRNEIDMFYFTKDCDTLTEDDKQEVYESFQGLLTSKSVCVDQRRGFKACNIDTSNMGIICGRKTTRRRRAANGTMYYETNQAMKMNMNVTALADYLKKLNCNQTACDMLGLTGVYCKPEFCMKTMGRYLRAAVGFSGAQLKRLMTDPDTLREMGVEVRGRQYQPKQGGVRSKMHADCDPGYEVKGQNNDSCVPCTPGSMHNAETGKCEMCPAGTFQYQSKQSRCIPCPYGSTSKLGSKTCFVCDDAFWGRNCSERCTCVHGICNGFNGRCMCHSGWEGDNCDIDIPGCRYSPCFPGVACMDKPAPGLGYTCEACPPSYRGDGVTCLATAPRVRRDLDFLVHTEL